MALRATVLAATLALGQSCDPAALKKEVQGYYPGALPSKAAGQVALIFHEAAPEHSGVIIQSENGTEVLSSLCQPGTPPQAISQWPAVLCPVSPLPVGSYTVLFSGDMSCGTSSYTALNEKLTVEEPAHIHELRPSHGPLKERTAVTIVGTNIGGPHVSCEFTFPAGEGAKFGCEMSTASYPAEQVTATTALCTMPAWPGPIQQYDGHGGFKPLSGAVCSKSVSVRLTNDVLVSSMEPIHFTYDDAAELLV